MFNLSTERSGGLVVRLKKKVAGIWRLPVLPRPKCEIITQLTQAKKPRSNGVFLLSISEINEEIRKSG